MRPRSGSVCPSRPSTDPAPRGQGRGVREGPQQQRGGHEAINAFRPPRPNIDLRRPLANTVITTYGDDFATANTEFIKRDTGRRGRQSQIWLRTDPGWRVVSAHVSFLPAQD